MATYDFEMLNFVGIEAPEGTDPESPELRDRAIKEFLSRIQSGEAEVNCFQIMMERKENDGEK